MFWLTVASDSYVEQSIVNVSFGKLAKHHSNAMTVGDKMKMISHRSLNIAPKLFKTTAWHNP